jgi:hypothetical protein
MAVLVSRSARDDGPVEAWPDRLNKDKDRGTAVLDSSPVAAGDK